MLLTMIVSLQLAPPLACDDEGHVFGHSFGARGMHIASREPRTGLGGSAADLERTVTGAPSVLHLHQRRLR